MDLTLIVNQLRDRLPDFGGRIGGVAEFKTASASNSIACPAAFVLPLSEDAETPDTHQVTRQLITQGFGVVVVLATQGDEKGGTALEAVENVKSKLLRALFGWQPNDECDPIYYEGGQLMSLDRAVLYWRYEFAVKCWIDSTDGYARDYTTSLPPLQTIVVTQHIADGAPDITQQITLPPP